MLKGSSLVSSSRDAPGSTESAMNARTTIASTPRMGATIWDATRITGSSRNRRRLGWSNLNVRCPVPLDALTLRYLGPHQLMQLSDGASDPDQTTQTSCTRQSLSRHPGEIWGLHNLMCLASALGRSILAFQADPMGSNRASNFNPPLAHPRLSRGRRRWRPDHCPWARWGGPWQ